MAASARTAVGRQRACSKLAADAVDEHRLRLQRPAHRLGRPGPTRWRSLVCLHVQRTAAAVLAGLVRFRPSAAILTSTARSSRTLPVVSPKPREVTGYGK